MKVSFALLSLVTAVTCAAVPVELLERLDSVTPVEYIWSGRLEKGGPELEYTGADLDDIEAQVQKDYPGLSIYSAPVVDDSVSRADEGPEALVERALEKRQTHCITRFGFGDGFQMNTLWRRLEGMRDLTFVVQSRQCISLGCHETAGAGLCNDLFGIAVRFSGNWVSPHLRALATGIGGDSCIWPGRTCGGRGKTPSYLCSTGIAGQRFFDGGNVNVIAGSCGAFPDVWNVGSL